MVEFNRWYILGKTLLYTTSIPSNFLYYGFTYYPSKPKWSKETMYFTNDNSPKEEGEKAIFPALELDDKKYMISCILSIGTKNE